MLRPRLRRVSRSRLALLPALGLALFGACHGASEADGGGGSGAGTAGGGGAGAGAGAGGSGGADACPVGVTCVTEFPFTDERDTSIEGASVLDGYACALATDESGPEVLYRVTVPEAGFLSAAVYDDAGVDLDVHILAALDAAACLDRGDLDARADVEAGDYWIVADTYASAGVPQAGPFRIDIGFVVPSQGPCDLEVGEMARVGDGGTPLPMPATGPIVLEAHLVTADEPAPYPTTATEELLEHYALSQATTGLVLHREQVWAPLEGGSFYGAGIGDPAAFPVLHEGWYVNMYWTSAARPAKGTRMILREPGGTRAVVVAAGYETGPGNLAHIGGTPEESHFYLGTGHLDTLQLGIAVDQALPYGPRVCQ
ncbi:MAG: hypothetical protein HY908_12305 [Myxococcales bacterium]|nr:hypothetical protein [Myxococcales bacterium]